MRASFIEPMSSHNRQPMIGVGTFRADDRAKQLVMQVLDSNRLSYGPMTQRFEAEFAKLHGARFGIMSNSGTSALQLALQAMKELHGWSDGDEVLVPAVTFVATANIVLHNRMHPVLVDVENNYYGLNPALLERAITPRTRAIIPVHLFGQPADMDPLVQIARRHSLTIIEDSAETMFATYKGRRVGTLGDIGCFSTYVAHLITTGIGGINVTNEPDYAVRIRSLLNHGRDSIYISIDDDNNKSVTELRTIVERRFRFVSIGHSFRVTEMEAALGIAQLEQWETMIAQRRRNAAYLSQAFRRFENHLQLPQIRPDCDHSFMMYPLVSHNDDKQALVNFLEERSIETRDMLPLTNQPVYHRLLGWKEESFPVARRINENGFYVGCHQDLSQGDLDYMLDCFDQFFHRTSTSGQDEPIALVLLADAAAINDDSKIEAIPEELFDKIIVVDSGMPADLRAKFEKRGFDVLASDGMEPLDVIARADDALIPELVVFLPWTGQWNLAEIPHFLTQLRRGYDMVVASRFMLGGDRRGPSGPLRSLGNRTFNFLANIVIGSNLSDGFSSFRALRRSKLAKAVPPGRGLAKLYALSLAAARQNWRVSEIPAVEMTRSTRQVARDAAQSIGPAFLALIRELGPRTSNPSSDRKPGRDRDKP
jgi:perosamine synthetase